jgi:chorismate mutase
MASPEDCKSLQEVRQEIDWIDEEIVARIGQRTR